MFLDRTKRQHKRLPELATQPNFDDSFMESGARTARVLHLIVVLRTDDLTGSPQFRGASNRSPSLLRKFRIACIGGSAGATDIYSDILRDLSSDSGLAVIVVPHRGMRDPSRLVRLLRLATSMSVVSIDDGLPLSPNSIFVCPPGFHLSLDGLTLYLQAWRTWGWPTTLSCFLNSLAGNGGPPSAAVILSGLGDDGSSALGAVKASGGLILAQSDPRWSGMTDCAVATGNVDLILNSNGIATALMNFANQSQRPT